MNPIIRWRVRRGNQRVDAIDQRWYDAAPLWESGRFAEYADEMGRIAEAYAREPVVTGLFDYAIRARMRRCEALVRAGLPAQAESESALVAELLSEVEGPDGPYQQVLRRRMDAAYRGEELADDG